MSATKGSAALGSIAITREEMLRFLTWLKTYDGPVDAAASEYVRATGDPSQAYRLALWAAAVAGARELGAEEYPPASRPGGSCLASERGP